MALVLLLQLAVQLRRQLCSLLQLLLVARMLQLVVRRRRQLLPQQRLLLLRRRLLQLVQLIPVALALALDVWSSSAWLACILLYSFAALCLA